MRRLLTHVMSLSAALTASLPTILLIALLPVAGSSCSSNKALTDVVTIDCTALKEVPTPVPADIQYVTLKIPEQGVMLDEIEHAKIFGDKIFLSGMRGQSLMSYDMQGNPTPVGRQGRGGEEYLRVHDFDIDQQCFVYVLDSSDNKLIIYDPNFQFIKKVALPFHIETLKCLPDERCLLTASSWNEGETADNEIVICDKDFNILSVEKFYDHSVVDDNFRLSAPSFTTLGDKVFYQRAPDENVWAFSAVSGKCVEKYYLDLGSDAIPVEHRDDLESFGDRRRNYRYLVDFCAITDKYIFGTIVDKNSDYKNYIIDREKGEIATTRRGGNSSGDFVSISGGKIIGEISDIELYGHELSVNIDSVSHVLTLRNIE